MQYRDLCKISKLKPRASLKTHNHFSFILLGLRHALCDYLGNTP